MSDNETAAKPPRRDGSDGQMPPGRAARTGVQLKKKELVDRVAATCGVKKADVRIAVDTALAVIVERLGAGDELVLPPLGRLRLIKEKQTTKSRIATLRLQTSTEVEAGKDPLAEAED
jgi:nucleoid DNA-binding protein